jgi:hypothetical protein
MVNRNKRKVSISYIYTHAPAREKRKGSMVGVRGKTESNIVLGKIVDSKYVRVDLCEVSNVIYNVTRKTGKSVCYLTPIIVQNGRYNGSRKKHKGWNCIEVPSNTEAKTNWYKYNELETGLIEVEWFNSDSDILSYEKIKDEEFYIEAAASYHASFDSDSDTDEE